MDFSTLRHRIIFLKPLQTAQNGMGENVPVWIPFSPVVNHNVEVKDGEVRLTHDHGGNAVLTYKDGRPYAQPLALNAFAVCAGVEPLTGKEYEEAQKLRAETTYRVQTRYFGGIEPDMKILFRNKTLHIVSVINVDERDRELEITAYEDGSGANAE
jgi:SPP1 family predicted phage head-tail adaptor